MGFNVNDYKGGGRDIEPMEIGTHRARLVGVVLLGLQPGREWQGQKKDPAHEVAFTYEFLDEFLKDEDGNDIEDKPRWLTEIMPLFGMASERAKSTIRYKAMDPTDKYHGDMSKLINTPLMVTIAHSPKKDGGVWENVSAVSPMTSKAAASAPELVNEPILFDPADADIEMFMRLPKFLKDRITSNLEFKGSKLEAMLNDVGDDNPGQAGESEPPREVSEDDNPF